MPAWARMSRVPDTIVTGRRSPEAVRPSNHRPRIQLSAAQPVIAPPVGTSTEASTMRCRTSSSLTEAGT
ncbi:MAG: hypothetical protein OSB43_09825 [Nocardioides sp.]|nr:hypothetical protein [Nocardioides sp.]